MPFYTQRNNELVQLLAGDFQRRYEPNFAYVNACSAALALPGLRGFWPFGTFDSNGDAYDQSSHGHHLTYNGEQPGPLYNYAMLRPYAQLDGTGDYFSRADAADFDILGTETYVTASRQGITLGGWFYLSVLPGAATYDVLMSKWNPAVSQSYMLRVLDTGQISGVIEDAVGNQDTVVSTHTVSIDEWFFAAFTWSGTGAATTESVWVSDLDQPDGIERTDDTPVRANIRNSTADFVIGGQHGGNRLITGYVSMCWLSTMCLTGISGTDVLDAHVWSVFQQQRALYGR